MPNYRELYFKMFRATEGAMRLLAAAQRECEDCYLSSDELELEVIRPTKPVPCDNEQQN